jgi:hypothetical protein
VGHEFSEIPEAHVVDPNRELNPYASPLAQGPPPAIEESEPIGIWRNADRLIMHKSAALPARCIRTNAFCGQSERYELKINPESLNQWARFLTFLCGVAISVGVYTFFRGVMAHYFAGMVMLLTILISYLFTLRLGQERTFFYYQSHASRKRRAFWLKLGTSLILLAIFSALLIVSPILENPLRGVLSSVVSFSAIVGGIMLVFVKFQFRIEPLGDKYFVVHGCGRSFRDSFSECSFSPFSSRPR